MSSVDDGSGLVLVVDDDRVALELALDVLESAGYPVSGATTVAEAVDVARRSRPDLVVLDLNLDEEDGLVLVQRLRNDPALRSIPVVVWSASTSPEDLGRVSAAGCVAFLAKPLSPQRLLDGVGAYVRPAQDVDLRRKRGGRGSAHRLGIRASSWPTQPRHRPASP